MGDFLEEGTDKWENSTPPSAVNPIHLSALCIDNSPKDLVSMPLHFCPSSECKSLSVASLCNNAEIGIFLGTGGSRNVSNFHIWQEEKDPYPWSTYFETARFKFLWICCSSSSCIVSKVRGAANLCFSYYNWFKNTRYFQVSQLCLRSTKLFV